MGLDDNESSQKHLLNSGTVELHTNGSKRSGKPQNSGFWLTLTFISFFMGNSKQLCFITLNPLLQVDVPTQNGDWGGQVRMG